MRGKFIVIDGMDGSGKGTQFALLRGALKGVPVYYTREPGGYGSPTAEFLRDVVLAPQKFGDIHPVPLCDFFLFWAARAQHVEEVVEPKRQEGMHVISDRYDSSTWAFQIYGEVKEFRRLFIDLRGRLPHFFWPDAYIILDLPAAVAYERSRADRERTQTRFDLKPLEYHERVRQGFAQFKRNVLHPDLVHIVDAKRSVEEVHEDVAKIVRKILSV